MVTWVFFGGIILSVVDFPGAFFDLSLGQTSWWASDLWTPEVKITSIPDIAEGVLAIGSSNR